MPIDFGCLKTKIFCLLCQDTFVGWNSYCACEIDQFKTDILLLDTIIEIHILGAQFDGVMKFHKSQVETTKFRQIIAAAACLKRSRD